MSKRKSLWLLLALILFASTILMACSSDNTNSDVNITVDNGVLTNANLDGEENTYTFHLADGEKDLFSKKDLNLELETEYILAFDENDEIYSVKPVTPRDVENQVKVSSLVVEPIDASEIDNSDLNEIEAYPLELEGEQAEIILYSSAELYGGDLIEDDGNQWRLLVKKDDKFYPLVDSYVTFGGLAFHIYEKDDVIHILAFEDSTAGLEVWDFAYKGGVFNGIMEYSTGNVNLLK